VPGMQAPYRHEVARGHPGPPRGGKASIRSGPEERRFSTESVSFGMVPAARDFNMSPVSNLCLKFMARMRAYAAKIVHDCAGNRVHVQVESAFMLRWK